MTEVSGFAGTTLTGRPSGNRASGRLGWLIALSAVVLLLAAKAAMVARLNVNWDEFFYLSHVHALIRGELTLVLQGAHTHLFRWLTLAGGNEVDQVVAARWVMFALLALSCLLLYRLALRWSSRDGAAFAVLAFLALSSVMKHGASFRADSMLLPLLLGAVLLLTAERRRLRGDLIAAVLLGGATAISIKSVLLAPVVLGIALAAAAGRRDGPRSVATSAGIRLLPVAAVALGTLGAILLAHRLQLPPAGSVEPGGVMSVSLRKTLLETSLLPQKGWLLQTLEADLMTWSMIVAGTLFALARRRYDAAALVLSVSPVLFYRNTYPYYYVVMLGPACVLAGLAFDGLRDITVRASGGRRAWLLPALLVLVTTLQGASHLPALRNDENLRQRLVIDVVHRIFPEPVPYVDHSGMIASFPKVNFFMSSWGVDTYRARGRSFMRKAIDEHAPPLLLANREVLDRATDQFKWLWVQDRRLIEDFYQPYWGPVRIAGADATLRHGQEAQIALPFPGAYRLEADCRVSLDGLPVQTGQVLEFTTAGTRASLPEEGPDCRMRLLWAAAGPAPAIPPPVGSLYSGL